MTGTDDTNSTKYAPHGSAHVSASRIRSRRAFSLFVFFRDVMVIEHHPLPIAQSWLQ
jgi:hypothetical protein